MYDPEEQYEEDDAEAMTPEPAPEETPVVTFTAQITREEIARLVANRYFEQFNNHSYRDNSLMKEAVDKELKRIVREKLKEYVEALSLAAVEDAVKDTLENGWPKTDSMGRDAGRVTVKELALNYLTKVDSYDRQSEATKLSLRIFEETFRKELKPLVDEAQARVRAALNTKLDEALRKALLDGMGLRS